MNCWWKTDKSAVHVGEPFGLTLTCRVMDTERAAVVPNVSDIEPTAIQLTPFDVVGAPVTRTSSYRRGATCSTVHGAAAR